MRSFSARRREEDLTEGFEVDIAFSRVSAARFRAFRFEGRVLNRRVEKRRWRRSGSARVSDTKAATWLSISPELTAMAVKLHRRWVWGFI